MRAASIMEQLEEHDYYAADGQAMFPSWVRAAFIMGRELAAERKGLDPAMLQYEVRLQAARRASELTHSAAADGTHFTVTEGLVAGPPHLDPATIQSSVVMFEES